MLHAHWLLVCRCAGCNELFDDCSACSEEAVAVLKCQALHDLEKFALSGIPTYMYMYEWYTWSYVDIVATLDVEEKHFYLLLFVIY